MINELKANMESNKKLSPIVTELFLRGRKLNISFVFVTQSYFKVHKTIRLTATHYFIMKILNKRELPHLASNHSSDVDFKDSIRFCKYYIKKPYSFLVNDSILLLGNPLPFRKNLI